MQPRPEFLRAAGTYSGKGSVFVHLYLSLVYPLLADCLPLLRLFNKASTCIYQLLSTKVVCANYERRTLTHASFPSFLVLSLTRPLINPPTITTATATTNALSPFHFRHGFLAAALCWFASPSPHVPSPLRTSFFISEQISDSVIRSVPSVSSNCAQPAPIIFICDTQG